jgi:hypothetical protein
MTAPASAPTDSGQGAAPDPTPAPTTDPVVETASGPGGVQPETDATTQPDGGQGLIARYLEGVDGPERDIVAEKLEAFRRDQDANVTRKFEELNRFQSYVPEGAGVEYLETPLALYENLMESPLETVQWVLDQFQKQGIDLRSQLLGEGAQPAPELAAPEGADDANRPLTVAEWQRLQEEQRAAQAEEAEAARRREVAQGWFDEATTKHGLNLTDEDIAVKQAILTHASQLVGQFRHLGDQAGKAAIETATEAFVNRFGKSPAPANPTTPEPKVATGGTPPSPQDKQEFATPAERKAFMLARLQAQATQE